MCISRISGNIVDVVGAKIHPGTLEVADGRIAKIIAEAKEYKSYVIPGFIDSHIQVQSSMVTPSEFGRLAIIHGTVGAVSDPLRDILRIVVVNRYMN